MSTHPELQRGNACDVLVFGLERVLDLTEEDFYHSNQCQNTDRYVYVPRFESGGSFFPKMFRRWIFALFTAQSTMVGMCLLKDSFNQAFSILFLMILTYGFKVGVAKTFSKCPFL